jgi:ABC-type Zn uptake system ZnuABC Zn-binding protein ZnuA
VLAVETFLADIAQNVAGDRLTVEALIPIGLDPHAFEPTPRDVVQISQSQVLMVNGAGFEQWLTKVMENAGSQGTVIEASAGLAMRTPQAGESVGHPGEGDPHFWLDPTLVAGYVENIRDAFSAADPAGKAEYTANAEAYVAKLEELDAWIEEQVATLPEEDRLLVMNHVSHGYYADRYGFRIAGAVVPSVATGESPTAKQLAALTETIRAEGVRAIFVELEENPQLADQIAAETGIVVVDDLRDHSLSEPDGEAATYIDMMKYDTRLIVDALK